MSLNRNVNKLVVVKKLSDVHVCVEDVVRTDLESNNRGFLALQGDGNLLIVVWLNKKITFKVVNDVSDAWWQRGSESEVVVVCDSGALQRYSLHFDTGLSCSLQLSAPSLLALIREKDASIRSLRSPRIWGHNNKHILLQPQSDRLVLLDTNGGGKPTVVAVVRSPPLRAAQLSQSTIILQPITGSDLYEYSLPTCRLKQMISLSLQRTSSEYIEWGSLTCSTSLAMCALVDSERHLYVANLNQRTPAGKKGGVIRSRVTLCQVIWPSNLQPSGITQISLSLSDTSLTVFCSTGGGDSEVAHYLSFELSTSQLTTQHCFTESVAIIPGTSHQLPDLFLTTEGIAMLIDEESSISSLDSSEVDLGDLVGALQEALTEQNIAKVTEVKAMVEQGLSVFLSSCNHVDGWLDVAEIRAQQFGKLADLLLSSVTRYAQIPNSYSKALALKDLARHHFLALHEEMSNALQYIDNESISQMVLQMAEQTSFYLLSVDQLQLPPEDADHAALQELHQHWAEQPLKDILMDALNTRKLKQAEHYLQLKPWIYGSVNTTMVINYCIDIAREKPNIEQQVDILSNMDPSYYDLLKQRLYSSDDLFEIAVVGSVLDRWELLTHCELLAVSLVTAVHRTQPDLLTLPPSDWSELVSLGDSSASAVVGPLTVGQVACWTPLAIMLLMTDLYAWSSDSEILNHVDSDVLWQYLLHQGDLNNLKKWIFHEFRCEDETETYQIESPTSGFEDSWSDLNILSRKPNSTKLSSIDWDQKSTNSSILDRSERIGPGLLSGPLYGSELGSSPKSQDEISLDTSSVGTADHDTWSLHSVDIRQRKLAVWSVQQFRPISKEMINLVLIAKKPFVEVILNILARFGVFTSSEKTNANMLMRRLLISGAFEKISQFRSMHSCQVSSDEIHSVFLEFFGERNITSPVFNYVDHFDLELLNGDSSEKFKLPDWSRLIDTFRQFIGNQNNKNIIFDLSLENLSLLSSKCQNSEELILPGFLTMLFSPNKTLEDYLSVDMDDSPEDNEEITALTAILSPHQLTPKALVEGLSSKLPYLEGLVHPRVAETKIDVSVYDLLSGSVPYDISNLFTWQKENKHGYNDNAVLPIFSSEDLIQKHGLRHSLDFLYYLRAARPTYACAAIITSIFVNKSKKKLEEINNAIYGLALSCWPDRGICAACVSVLIMTHLDAEPLRLILTIAFQILQMKNEESAKLKWEQRQAQEHLVTTEIREVLLSLCNKDTMSQAASILLEMLENSVIIKMTSKFSEPISNHGKSISESEGPENLNTEQMELLLSSMQLCVDFASFYLLSWPSGILKYLAGRNMWLMFLVVAQVFNTPRLTLLGLTEAFSSIALREHMTFALTHIYYYKENRESRDKKSKETARRSTLYNKIGIQPRKEGHKSLSPVTSGDETVRSSSPSEPETSVNDDSLSTGTTDTLAEGSFDAWQAQHGKDLYSILLSCHVKDNPAFELLTASVALNAPVLAVFAACYDRHNPAAYLAVWLYTQVSGSAKSKLHLRLLETDSHANSQDKVFKTGNLNDDKLSYDLPVEVSNKIPKTSSNISDSVDDKNTITQCRSCDMCILEAGWDEVTLLILSHIEQGSLDATVEGFKIFYSSCPLLPLLNALQEVSGMGRANVISQVMDRCCSAMSDSKEWPNSSVSSPSWLSATTVEVIGCALDTHIVNVAQQEELLQAVAAVSQRPPFSCHSINWLQVSQLCSPLGSIREQITFKDILMSFHTGTLKQCAHNMVVCLSNKRCFAKALKVAQLTCLPVFTILCAQVRAQFEKEQHSITENLASLNDFLKKINGQLEKENVPSEMACGCFVAIGEGIKQYTMRYICLQYAVIWAYTNRPESRLSDAVAEAAHFKENDQIQADSINEKLECDMWTAYIQAMESKESESSKLSVTTVDNICDWPWEGPEGSSPLDGTIIKKMATVNYQILSNFPAASSELKEEIETEKSVQQKRRRDDEIQKLIGNCVDQGLIVTALRVLQYFGRENKDLKALMNLLSVADGSVKFEEEETADVFHKKEKLFDRHRKKEDQELFATPMTSESTCGVKSRRRGISISSSLSVLSIDGDESDYGTKSPALHRIAGSLNHGRKFGERVIMLYRVAAALDLSYLYVVHHKNPISLVGGVLRLGSPNVSQLARDLIQALPIPDVTVTNFLCEEAVATITAGPGTSRQERLLLWEELETQWCDLISLCPDTVALGNQLLSIGQRMGSSHPDQVHKVHSMSVELVIRANDCYTASANMEGISTVLKTVLSLTNSLLQHSQFPLMVRLLTGVGRYNEMSYIIDALREHDQFEHLLSRGLDSKGRHKGLDRALVHYLRSKYPNDTETLRLVALHFLLYSEVASMWAADAETAVNNVIETTVDLGASCNASFGPGGSPTRTRTESIGKTLPRKPSVNQLHRSSVNIDQAQPDYLHGAEVSTLTQAMHSYAHAAQYYMQDGQLATAVEYSRLAQLTALQISHVKQNTYALRLIRLTHTSVALVTTRYLKVAEAILVGRAYDHSVDWAAALYHQFVNKGDDSYMTEYLHNFHLTPDIILDVVKKLEHDGVTRERLERMASLLVHVQEADIVYRVASQLGLRKTIDSCLTSSAIPYLKDTVFTKGFTYGS